MKNKIIEVKNTLFSWKTAFIAVLAVLAGLACTGAAYQLREKTLVVMNQSELKDYNEYKTIVDAKLSERKQEVLSSLKTGNQSN